MSVVYSREIVIGTLAAFCNNDSPDGQMEACASLAEFKASGESWFISAQLLGEMEEQDQNVLSMAASILKSKVRDSIEDLNTPLQEKLKESLLFLLNSVALSPRKDLKPVVRIIGVLIVNLGLQANNWVAFVPEVIDRFGMSAPLQLLQVLQVLPEEAFAQGKKCQLLRRESNTLVGFLNLCIKRKDIIYMDLMEASLLCMTSWLDAHVLDACQLIDNRIWIDALRMLEQPNLFPDQLLEKASDAVVALLQHLASLAQGARDAAVEQRIFDTIYKLGPIFLKCSRKKRNIYAQIFVKLTEAFAGILPGQPKKDLCEKGPLCFTLLVEVASHCSYVMISETLDIWQMLSDQVLFRCDEELTKVYEALVVQLLDVLFKITRLRDGVDAMQTLQRFREHVTEVVPKLFNLISLDHMVADLLDIALDTNIDYRETEIALFFIRLSIKDLHEQDPELMLDLLNTMPTRLDPHSNHLSVVEEAARVLTECHKLFDNENLRYEFIDDLVELTYYSSKVANKKLFSVFTDCFVELVKCRPVYSPKYEIFVQENGIKLEDN